MENGCGNGPPLPRTQQRKSGRRRDRGLPPVRRQESIHQKPRRGVVYERLAGHFTVKEEKGPPMMVPLAIVYASKLPRLLTPVKVLLMPGLKLSSVASFRTLPAG